MKTYVFITRQICAIGGAEQYIHNKVNYLERTGWRVLVFSGRHGSILIDDFRRFEPLIYPALECCPECFSKWEVKNVISRITAEIGLEPGGSCIVESNSAIRAVWAELIAREIGARHLAIIMQENHKYDSEMKAFLRFKYDRHELAGIAESSVAQMLGDDTVEKRDDTRISASCNNTIVACEDHYSELLDKSADFTFGSIGRLVKPCVLPIAQGFHKFFCDHTEWKFNLVLIGDAPTKERETAIRELMKDCKNVNLYFLGTVYPIPQALVDKIDVFVSTAGSANATYRVGRPTVLVHPSSGEPVGVIGLDFNFGEKKMYDATPGLSIDSCIENALRNADKITYSAKLGDEALKIRYAEFDRQISFAEYKKTAVYYDVSRLMRLKTQPIHSHAVQRIIGHTLGAANLERVKKLKMRKRIHE